VCIRGHLRLTSQQQQSRLQCHRLLLFCHREECHSAWLLLHPGHGLRLERQ
jgi:hypothetical protein